MTETDAGIRVALLVTVLLMAPVAVYYRIRSQATGERLDRRQEGLFILLSLRPLGIAALVGFVAWLINPDSMRWSALSLPQWLRWIGAAIAATAALLFLWTLTALGRNLTDTVVTRREHTLVTHGPYRWVRHPFYGSGALLLLGASLATANWFLPATGAAALALLVVRTHTEEEHLVRRFGDAYRAYMGRTGRFLPRFRRA